ncbi:hypothetical protein PQX77_022049 [Marasmius sp. AFHP31]|nr:hypothetical protein PQX77_022049 [Marasmius sp. AFHP31]
MSTRDQSIYDFFTEHREQEGLTSCTKCGVTPLSFHGKPEFFLLRNENLVKEDEIESFRTQMVSLRYKTISTPESSENVSPELRHIKPLAAVFKKYVFKDCPFWYEVVQVKGFEQGAGFTFWCQPEWELDPQPLTTVLIKPSGSICWKDFIAAREEQYSGPAPFHCLSAMSLMEHIYDYANSTRIPYIVLTDEVHAVLVNGFKLREWQEDIDDWAYALGIHLTLSHKMSLRSVIGAVIHKVSEPEFHYSAFMPPYFLSGALNAPRTSYSNEQASSLSDFDLFTMQRCRDSYKAFVKWKKNAQDSSLSNPLVVNDELLIVVDAFAKREPTLCFRLPLEKPPTDSLDVLTRRPRPRSQEVDDLLSLSASSEGTLRYRVTDIIKRECGKFSQVTFGTLLWTSKDGKIQRGSEAKLCLKMFDETLFPIPDMDEYDDSNSWYAHVMGATGPKYRLGGVYFAPDMVRGEMAVYDRLRYLQGTLLLHTYGFHEIILPSSRSIYGFLMEVAPGDSLSSFPIKEQPEPVQIDLIRRLSEGIRTLRYGGVHQPDWHLGQVIIHDNEHLDFSFIDFSFVQLRRGVEFAPGVAELFQLGLDGLQSTLIDGGFDPRIVYRNWVRGDDLEC